MKHTALHQNPSSALHHRSSLHLAMMVIKYPLLKHQVTPVHSTSVRRRLLAIHQPQRL
ncbi:MAG TPA: hypothetical protein VJK54_04565 [Chthoniobacterales bacterium]|nr:hypothetical protein [Chthoniobacterales bacterium]